MKTLLLFANLELELMNEIEEKLLNEVRAKLLNDKGGAQARELCLAFLNDNPSSLKVRVALAKTYFLDNYHGFAIRELQELSKVSEEPLIGRILRELGVFSASERSSSSKVIAEVLS